MQHFSKKWIAQQIAGLFIVTSINSCAHFMEKMGLAPSDINTVKIRLPFLRNDVNVCYFLDDFMPPPSDIVKGKKGPLFIKQFFYRNSQYKDIIGKDVLLSFSSSDDFCWSLYEEAFFEPLK